MTSGIAREQPPKRRARGPSAGKRRAVLDAARELFLERGFAGTGMDDVATAAGVSKQTVYSHFSDKQGLFTELIESDVGQLDVAQHPLVTAMPDTDDVRRDLRAYARFHLSVVMQPHLLRMRRMLIGEAERFPELARAWFANGPELSVALFASWFAALDRRGLLRVADPVMAGEHYNWLILSTPVNRAMSEPLDRPLYTRRQLDRYADEAVRVFLAAYGVSTDSDPAGSDPAGFGSGGVDGQDLADNAVLGHGRPRRSSAVEDGPVTRAAPWSPHARHAQELVDLDRRTGQHEVRVAIEEGAQRVERLGLHDGVAAEGIRGLRRARADRRGRCQRRSQVDDGRSGLLRPRRPGVQPGLGLLRCGVGHLVRGGHAGAVEHEVLGHHRSRLATVFRLISN